MALALRFYTLPGVALLLLALACPLYVAGTPGVDRDSETLLARRRRLPRCGMRRWKDERVP